MLEEVATKRLRLGDAAPRRQQSDSDSTRERQPTASARTASAAPKLLASARLGQRLGHSSGSDPPAHIRPTLADAKPLGVGLWPISLLCCILLNGCEHLLQKESSPQLLMCLPCVQSDSRPARRSAQASVDVSTPAAFAPPKSREELRKVRQSTIAF